jgi:glycosyltransferase involved in cell wall biosynthesis
MVAADDYVHYLTHKVNVFFTEDNKPETLSSAMVEMYVNPEMRRRIGQAGREYALKNFNYHILTKDLLDFVLK